MKYLIATMLIFSVSAHARDLVPVIQVDNLIAIDELNPTGILASKTWDAHHGPFEGVGTVADIILKSDGIYIVLDDARNMPYWWGSLGSIDITGYPLDADYTARPPGIAFEGHPGVERDEIIPAEYFDIRFIASRMLPILSGSSRIDDPDQILVMQKLFNSSIGGTASETSTYLECVASSPQLDGCGGRIGDDILTYVHTNKSTALVGNATPALDQPGEDVYIIGAFHTNVSIFCTKKQALPTRNDHLIVFTPDAVNPSVYMRPNCFQNITFDFSNLNNPLLIQGSGQFVEISHDEGDIHLRVSKSIHSGEYVQYVIDNAIGL